MIASHDGRGDSIVLFFITPPPMVMTMMMTMTMMTMLVGQDN